MSKRQVLAGVVTAIALLVPANSHAGRSATPDRTTGPAIVGHVHFAGQVPKAVRSGATTDPSCPQLAAGPNQEFVTGPDGARANVVEHGSDRVGAHTFD